MTSGIMRNETFKSCLANCLLGVSIHSNCPIPNLDDPAELSWWLESITVGRTKVVDIDEPCEVLLEKNEAFRVFDIDELCEVGLEKHEVLEDGSHIYHITLMYKI